MLQFLQILLANTMLAGHDGSCYLQPKNAKGGNILPLMIGLEILFCFYQGGGYVILGSLVYLPMQSAHSELQQDITSNLLSLWCVCFYSSSKNWAVKSISYTINTIVL